MAARGPRVTGQHVIPSVGEIWTTDFGAPSPLQAAYSRPALVYAPARPREWGVRTVLLIPFTTHLRDYVASLRVPPSTTNGLTRTSNLQIDMIRSVPLTACSSRLGVIDPDDWARVRHLAAQYMGYLHA